ncbi:MAG: tyrosine-type recombinase/integrase [Chlorobiaceae bacterium]
MKTISSHKGSHSLATLALAAGAPIEAVREMLGHRSIKSTERYAEVVPGTMRKWAGVVQSKALLPGEVNPESIVTCFMQYMEQEEYPIFRAEFEMNLQEKPNDPRFLNDMSPLLTSGISWDASAAARYVLDSLAPLMP